MKKVFLIISKILFIISFLALNIIIGYGLYSFHSENKQHNQRQEQIKIDQKSCMGDTPLYLGHLDKTCAHCNYEGYVEIKDITINPCPNRQIVNDECCSGTYSILPETAKQWKSYGQGKYCNPNIFCDPAPTGTTFLNILSIISIVSFYLFLLLGTLWSFKKLRAKWMILPISIIAISILLVKIFPFFLL